MKLSHHEARLLAVSALKSNEDITGVPVQIIDEDTIEASEGWVFFWNSTEYLTTGTFSSALAGNGPIFVSHDKIVYFLPSYQTWEESLNEIDQKWSIK
jgi:hypothetical protein